MPHASMNPFSLSTVDLNYSYFSLQVEKESKSELQASIQKSEDLVQDMLHQLESSRTQAEELEKELLKEKEYGRELKIDTKRCKSRSWIISQENRNMTVRLKVMSEQLDNTTQEILLLTAKVEARKSAVVPTAESSLPELQEKFEKLVCVKQATPLGNKINVGFLGFL